MDERTKKGPKDLKKVLDKVEREWYPNQVAREGGADNLERAADERASKSLKKLKKFLTKRKRCVIIKTRRGTET